VDLKTLAAAVGGKKAAMADRYGQKNHQAT
jgi:prolyl-tRNA editing enzyme YbaK/EbsC (Cys-tRNA(Pro) deacylase)